MEAKIKSIAIDLTPLLPGGDNGGIKVLIFYLLGNFAKKYPQVMFTLLTLDRAYQELRMFECENMRVETVDLVFKAKSLARNSLKNKFISLISKLFHHEDSDNLGYNYLYNRHYDMLFSPFGSTIFLEPLVPSVLIICDLQYVQYPYFFSEEECQNRSRLIYDAKNKSATIATISEYSKNELIEKSGFSEKQVASIPICLPRKFTENSLKSDTILNTLSLTSGRYFIYPANFWRHKNHEILLLAWRQATLTDLASDIKLVCTGSLSDRRDFIIESAKKLQIEKSVIFPGYLEDDEFSYLLSRAMALVFPSLYEGFGIPLVEAMSLGVPVICSNVCSLPEVSGIAALYFDPRKYDEISDAIIKIAKEKKLRKELSEAGLHQAQLFANSDKMIEDYWRLFKTACQSQKLKSFISGVYADGWCSEAIKVFVHNSGSLSYIEAIFYLPKWRKIRNGVINICINNRKSNETHYITPGQIKLIKVDLVQDKNEVTIELKPTFVLAKANEAGDQRLLSLQLNELTVRDEIGNIESVFLRNGTDNDE